MCDYECKFESELVVSVNFTVSLTAEFRAILSWRVTMSAGVRVGVIVNVALVINVEV